MDQGLSAYKKTAIHTASKEQILLMLYQAAIKNCKLAIKAMEDKDLAKKGEYIGKFQDIIIELNNSLDHSVGGDIADQLSSLYDYLIYTSTQANIKIDPKEMSACMAVINTLYKGWKDAIKNLKNQNNES